MTTSARVTSDLAIAPGEYLHEVLAAQGMSQADLARRLGRPMQAVNEIVKGRKAITPETALQLEQVVPVPAHIWTGLEEAYQLALARAEERESLDEEVDLIDAALYRKLAEHGQVPAVKGASKESRRQRVRGMRRFFGVASLCNVPDLQTFRAAFRVSTAGRIEEYALAAWLRWGEKEASKREEVGKYDGKALKALIPWLRTCTLQPPKEWQPKVAKALAECGIVLVVLPHLPRTRAHGAAYWLSSSKAVLQLSIRRKRVDIFWFSFFHELAHLLRHRTRDVYVSWDPNGDERKSMHEREADRFAGDILIPPKDYEAFRENSGFSAHSIVAFAESIGIHPSIVLGRLQRDHLVSQKDPYRLHDYYDWADD